MDTFGPQCPSRVEFSPPNHGCLSTSLENEFPLVLISIERVELTILINSYLWGMSNAISPIRYLWTTFSDYNSWSGALSHFPHSFSCSADKKHPPCWEVRVWLRLTNRIMVDDSLVLISDTFNSLINFCRGKRFNSNANDCWFLFHYLACLSPYSTVQYCNNLSIGLITSAGHAVPV